MKANQSNVINFRHSKQNIQPEIEQKGEMVYMPFVVYMPVFLPAQVAEQVKPEVAETSQEKYENNVVSIYDYLGEI